MRHLSDSFFNCLKNGFLSGITEAVKEDPDLNLEIRDSYINVYYKGNSLIKLTETPPSRYKVHIHEKFLKNLNLPIELSETNMHLFLSGIPFIKENIIRYGKHSSEVEYEQIIIRANNFEPRNNSEYFIVDRQYEMRAGRFDLTGIFWDRNGRRKNQEVPVCLMEIKFALNPDINKLGEQLTRYYDSIKPHSAVIASEMQAVFRQKIELGLYNQPEKRLNALKTLTFSPNIEEYQIILIMVDYNRNSKHLDLEKLANLPFANQLRVFHSGFAMWQQNVKPLI